MEQSDSVSYDEGNRDRLKWKRLKAFLPQILATLSGKDEILLLQKHLYLTWVPECEPHLCVPCDR